MSLRRLRVSIIEEVRQFPVLMKHPSSPLPANEKERGKRHTLSRFSISVRSDSKHSRSFSWYGERTLRRFCTKQRSKLFISARSCIRDRLPSDSPVEERGRDGIREEGRKEEKTHPSSSPTPLRRTRRHTRRPLPPLNAPPSSLITITPSPSSDLEVVVEPLRFRPGAEVVSRGGGGFTLATRGGRGVFFFH